LHADKSVSEVAASVRLTPKAVREIGHRYERRVSSILRHPAWEFTDLLPMSCRREPAC